MGKDSPSPPAAPDPAAVARAQQGLNLETAVAQQYMGAGGSVTPFGSTLFEQVGSRDISGQEVPQYQSYTTLSPAEQARLNTQNQVQMRALNLGEGLLGGVAEGLGATNLPDIQEALRTGVPAPVPDIQPYQLPEGPERVSSVTPGDFPMEIPGVGDLQRDIDVTGLPGVPGAGDFGAERLRVEEALYSRLDR